MLTWHDGLLIELFLFYLFFLDPSYSNIFHVSFSCFVVYLQDEFRLILSCSGHDNHFLLHTCSFQVDLPSVFRSLMCIYVLTPCVYPVHICIQLACPVDRTTEYTRSIDRNILHQYFWAAPYKSGLPLYLRIILALVDLWKSLHQVLLEEGERWSIKHMLHREFVRGHSELKKIDCQFEKNSKYLCYLLVSLVLQFMPAAWGRFKRPLVTIRTTRKGLEASSGQVLIPISTRWRVNVSLVQIACKEDCSRNKGKT